MTNYEFRLVSVMPMLMHQDDVMASDRLKAWRTDANNKEFSVAGDDRSPPWTWQTYLYQDGTHIALPQENLMAALRYAGAKIPTGKRQENFKKQSQSGLLIGSDFCEFLIHGKQVKIKAVTAHEDAPFSEQVKLARGLGFDLSVKRAAVNQSKHVRVRPKFDAWEVRGMITVSDKTITPAILRQMFDMAGKFAGLGDWRPSSKKGPGPYGMFSAELTAA